MFRIWFNRTIYTLLLIAMVWILIQNHWIEFGNLSKNDLTKNVKTIPSKQFVQHDTVLKWKTDTFIKSTKGKPDVHIIEKSVHDTFTIDKRYQVAVGDSQECNSDSLYQKVAVKDLKPEQPTQTKIFIGGITGYSMNYRQPVFAPAVIFEDKKERLWMLNYDLIGKTVTGGVAWKVHL